MEQVKEYKGFFCHLLKNVREESVGEGTASSNAANWRSARQNESGYSLWVEAIEEWVTSIQLLIPSQFCTVTILFIQKNWHFPSQKLYDCPLSTKRNLNSEVYPLSAPLTSQVWWLMPNIATVGIRGRANQEFKFILSCTKSLRLAWAISNSAEEGRREGEKKMNV